MPPAFYVSEQPCHQDEPTRKKSSSAASLTRSTKSGGGLFAGSPGKMPSSRQIVAEEYLQNALDMLSFAECPDLCRAVPLEIATRACGSIWSDSKGSESTFALSQVVTKIDSFISHNWIVGRFRKWVAISFRFNFGIAAACTILANVIVTILVLFEIIPLVPVGDDVACTWNGVVGGPVFFFSLFFGRSVVSYFKSSPKVFVDKICIHQVSHTLQIQGIMKLGAFLGCSEEMLILYTNIYLQKLWTVYEVAAFVLLRPNAAESMRVVPVSVVTVFLAAFGFAYIGTASGQILEASQLDYNWVTIVACICTLIYMYGLRTWHRDKLLMQERILNFKVRECICAVESDRSVVYANIAALVKAFGFTPPTADLDEALDAFDDLVRRELPPAFGWAFGWCSFEYYHYVRCGYIMTGVLVFGRVSLLPFTPYPRKALSGAVLCLHGMFVCEFVLFEVLSGTKLHLRGCKEFIWLVACMAAVWGPAGIHQYCMLELMDLSEESTLAYAFSLAVGIVSTIGGVILLSRRRPGLKTVGKQKTSPSESSCAGRRIEEGVVMDHSVKGAGSDVSDDGASLFGI